MPFPWNGPFYPDDELKSRPTQLPWAFRTVQRAHEDDWANDCLFLPSLARSLQSLCLWLWKCSYSVRRLHQRPVKWRHGQCGVGCRTQSPGLRAAQRPRVPGLSHFLMSCTSVPPPSPDWFPLTPIFLKGVVCLIFQNKIKTSGNRMRGGIWVVKGVQREKV